MTRDRRGNDGATGCVNGPRVLAAVRQSLSEENSSSSSLSGLPSELKQHLAACPACAASAAALDPTLVFAPLSVSVAGDAPARGAKRSVEGDARVVATAVLDEVRRRARVSPPPAPAPRREWDVRRILQAAALVALAAGLAGLVRWENERGTLVSAPTPSAPVVAAEAVPAPSLPARPLIEGTRDPNVRVYEFAAASSKEPAVVFVANPNADL